MDVGGRLTHVGRPQLPPVPEPEDQPSHLLLDTEQPVVNQLMMGTTDRQQVLLDVFATVSRLRHRL